MGNIKLEDITVVYKDKKQLNEEIKHHPYSVIYKLAITNIEINNNEVSAILDSGSFTNALSEELYKRYSLKPNRIYNSMIIQADKSLVQGLGQVRNLRVRISKTKVL